MPVYLDRQHNKSILLRVNSRVVVNTGNNYEYYSKTEKGRFFFISIPDNLTDEEMKKVEEYFLLLKDWHKEDTERRKKLIQQVVHIIGKV